MPKAGSAPDLRGEPTAAVEAVLDLLVEAIWTDVMGEIRDDGPVPEGTEPSAAEASECLDEGADVPCPPEAA